MSWAAVAKYKTLASVRPLVKQASSVTRADSQGLMTLALMCYQQYWDYFLNNWDEALEFVSRNARWRWWTSNPGAQAVNHLLTPSHDRSRYLPGLVMFGSIDALQSIDWAFDAEAVRVTIDRLRDCALHGLPSGFAHRLNAAPYSHFCELMASAIGMMTIWLNRAFTSLTHPLPPLYMGLTEELDVNRATFRYRSVTYERSIAIGFAARDCCLYGVVVDETVDKAISVDAVLRTRHEGEIILPKKLHYRVYSQQEAKRLAEELKESRNETDQRLAHQVGLAIASLTQLRDDESPDKLYYLHKFKDARIVIVRKPQPRMKRRRASA